MADAAKRAESWLADGRGEPPAVGWAFSTEGPLVALGLAREGGRTLAADASGGLTRLDPAGRVEKSSRAFRDLTALAVADTGTAAACAFGADVLAWVTDELNVRWTLDLPARITAVAVDPHGRHVAVALANADVTVYTETRRRLTRFQSVRPLDHLLFLAGEPRLVGAAGRGLLAAYDLRGTPLLDLSTFANCGGVAATGDGKHLALAAFNLGVQRYDEDGTLVNTLVLDGSPARVALPFRGPAPLAVATLEHGLYRLNKPGEVTWGAPAPGPVAGLCQDAFGRTWTVGLEAGRVLRLEF